MKPTRTDHSQEEYFMADEKIGFGILGLGMIAEFHAGAVAESKHGGVVAVASRDIEKAKKFASQFAPEAKPYGSYKQMVMDPEVQVVNVCTPSGTHWNMAKLAANAGKHILLEKPLEITSERMTQMIRHCRRRRVKLGVVFQRRTHPASKKAKAALEQGLLGKLVLGELAQKWYRSPEYYSRESWKGTWKHDGGGACMNQAVHGVDLLLWLMGDVKSVFAYADHLVHDIEVEDTAVAVLKFRNGAFGTITATTSCNPGESAVVSIHGSRGTIALTDKIHRWAIAEKEGELAKDHDELVSAGTGGGVADPRDIDIAGHVFHIDDMAEAVIQNRDPLCTGEQARKSVDLILAIYKSAQTGREVRL